jgi:hypothetical protein
MDSNEVKGKLWNMCIEKGIFNKIKGDDFKRVQEIFEKIIKSYGTVEPSQDIFNRILDSISLEIQNGFNVSYEDMKKEYEQMLTTPAPKQIDFTDSNLIQQNIQNQSQIQNQIKLEEIIMTQNKILMQILETQIKIIETLKK